MRVSIKFELSCMLACVENGAANVKVPHITFIRLCNHKAVRLSNFSCTYMAIPVPHEIKDWIIKLLKIKMLHLPTFQ